MPKSASPVRLQADLMQAATIKGERNHRSAAEQIEYWANIGRSVANSIDPDKLLAVSTGLARLHVEPVESPIVDVDSVFDTLEIDRESGKLQADVQASSGTVLSSKRSNKRTSNNINNTETLRYQSSKEFPGNLEQVDADGNIVVGQFRNGKFTPLIHS